MAQHQVEATRLRPQIFSRGTVFTKSCHALGASPSFINLFWLAAEKLFHAQTEPTIIPLAMDPSIIERHPIGNGLDSFHEAFRSTCAQLGIPVSTDSADTVEQVMKNGVPESKELVSDLILALLSLRASRFLQSPDGRSTVGGELGSLFSRLQSNQQDPQVVVPLLTKVVERALDLDIWVAVYELITPAQQPTAPAELTPPQSLESSVELTGLRPPTTPKKSGPPKEFITPNKPIASKDTQTPTGYNTAGIVNSSEPRVYFDKELERELGTSVHVGVSGFEDAFFGEVSNLQSIAKTVFEKCQEGRDPLFNQERGGWQGWPSDAAEPKVLDWFQALARKLLKLPTQNHMPGSRMRVLRQHNKPVRGSVSRRKLDIGFVHKKKSLKEGQHNWSHILIPGELKSNPNEDTHSSTWHDLARYVREIFNAQESRRFVLGFTLCGSLMRLWEFDRLGAIASSAFDINQDGLRFVSTVLGYLWLTDEQLGFDPTITSEGAQRFITITKGATTERLVIDEVINRYPAINGRGTICWKVHPVGNESQTFVVKDSWQYPERDEEGEYLREAAQSGVVNVSRYYHHETVRVGGKDDTIVGNVRGGLDIGGAENAYKVIADLKREEEKQKKDEDLRVSISRLTIEKKSGTASSNTPAVASATLQEDDIGTPTRDRIHRRVILQDSGRPVYKASSRVALLAALEGAITGMWHLNAP